MSCLWSDGGPTSECFPTCGDACECPFPPDERVRNRFTSLVGLAEEELRSDPSGPTAKVLVGELQRLAADSETVNDLLCEDTPLCLRFDAAVAAWKELRRS